MQHPPRQRLSSNGVFGVTPLCLWGGTLLLVAEQGGCGPQHGRLAMQVSGFALAVQVVLHAVQLAGAGADLGDVVVLVHIANDGDPGTPRRRSVGGRVQPAVFDAGTGKLDSMQYYL